MNKAFGSTNTQVNIKPGILEMPGFIRLGVLIEIFYQGF